MSESQNNEGLHKRMDAFFQAQEDREEDKLLADKYGISTESAALIRVWWAVHDEREAWALERDEELASLREEIEDDSKKTEN